MNEDFKKIAKGLGVVLPACLLSIGTANATVPMPTTNNDVPSVCVKQNKGNDVISHMLANSVNYSSDRFSPDHTDSHSDWGGDHSNYHSDTPHADSHSNTTKMVNQQCVHTDKHTNRNEYNRHTNSGNKEHTDRHSNRNSGC